MKKVLIPLILLLAVVVAILVWRRQLPPGSRSQAPALVPRETVLFLHLPDIGQTKARWRRTALWQIEHEPEVQAFLAQPLSRIPSGETGRGRIDRFLRMDPREAFIALTKVTDKTPTFVAGFDFGGNKEDVEKVLAELKDEVHRAYPTGKSDIIKYRSDEIETFAANDFTLAAVFKRNWYFISNDLDLLKATIDRCEGAAAGPSLRDNADFQKSVARMPGGYDTLAFAQMKTITERLTAVFETTGQKIDPRQMAELKSIDAIAASTRLDGETMRDTIFVLKPSGGKGQPLSRDSLAFTTADTLLYYASAIKQEQSIDLPDSSLDTTGVLRYLHSLARGLKKEGLSIADFYKAFGPEMGLVVDWASNASTPSLLITLDVKDSATARRFVNFFVNGQLGSEPWMRQEVDGNPCYTLPPSAAVWFTPAIVMTDKFLVCGFNLESAKLAVKRLKANDARLDTTGVYRKAAATVVQPTSVFGFIDGKAAFEKVYDTLKPLVMMSAAFLPKMKDYVDLGKMPSVEVISKHLGPIVYSQGTTEDGLLFESTGVVTFSQALFGIGAGVAIAAVPALKSELLKPNMLHSAQSPFPIPGLPAAVPTPAPTAPPMATPAPTTDATNLPTPEPSPTGP